MAIIHKKYWMMIFPLLCLASLLTSCGDEPPKVIRMGDQAPTFTANDLQGQAVALENHAGKPVVLRFFLPDCKYCRADTAACNDYYQTYKAKGLGVIYINTDPKPGEVQKFVNELKITFPVVLDPDRKIADQYRVQVVPQTIVLDPAHRVIGAILGGVSKEELDKLLSPFLK